MHKVHLAVDGGRSRIVTAVTVVGARTFLVSSCSF